jgi:hypothetical protein
MWMIWEVVGLEISGDKWGLKKFCPETKTKIFVTDLPGKLKNSKIWLNFGNNFFKNYFI